MTQPQTGKGKRRLSKADKVAVLLLLLLFSWTGGRLVYLDSERTELSRLPYSSRLLFDSMLFEFRKGRPYSEILEATQFRGNLLSLTRLMDGGTVRLMTYSICPDDSNIAGLEDTWVYAIFIDEWFAGFMEPGSAAGHSSALWDSVSAPNESISFVLGFQRANVSSLMRSSTLSSMEAAHEEQLIRERLASRPGSTDWGLALVFVALHGLLGSNSELEQTIESRQKWQVLDLPLDASMETLTRRFGPPSERWLVQGKTVVEFDPRQPSWYGEHLSVGKFLAVLGESGLEEFYSSSYHYLVQFRQP